MELSDNQIILVENLEVTYHRFIRSWRRPFGKMEPFKALSGIDFSIERGDIVDRNGIILARNIDIYSAGVRPALVRDEKKLLIN